MRCFIALELSQNVIKVLADALRDISHENFIEAKFVEAYNLHLTLKFLGELDKHTCNAVVQKLSSLEIPAFTCVLGKLGVFTEKEPRILYVSLVGQKIFDLASSVEQALAGVVPHEQRPFAAHITLARIKRILRKDFYEYIRCYDIKPVEFSVNSFTLKQSQLTSDGPIYTDIACYQLKNLEP